MVYCAVSTADVLREEHVADLVGELERYKRDNNLTYRDMEELIGVGKTTFHDLMHPDPNDPTRRPRITTFVKIAELLRLPLWDVIQKAGYDSGLTDSTEDQARQLVSLAEHQEDVRRLLDLLLRADPKDRHAVLNYLAVRDEGQENESSQ